MSIPVSYGDKHVICYYAPEIEYNQERHRLHKLVYLFAGTLQEAQILMPRMFPKHFIVYVNNLT